MTPGRVTFTAGSAEVREDRPFYFISPPDPAAPPACSRQPIANYTVTFSPLFPHATIDFDGVENSLGAEVEVKFLPASLPLLDGMTVEVTVIVDGSSLAADLFDLALTVDGVDGGVLLSPGDTAGGAAFDLGDFPATATAIRDEGLPAMWGARLRVRVESDPAVISGQVLGSSPCIVNDAEFRIEPFLTRYTGAGIDLRWETDREAPAFAGFGGSGCDRVAAATVSRRRRYDNYDWSFPRRFNSFLYAATLTGLEQGADVWWRVPGGAGPAGPRKFRFGARPGQKFSFGLLGDTRTGDEIHGWLAAMMAGEDLDFYLNTGDLVENSNLDSEWQTFFNLEAPLLEKSPFFPTLGNHDLQAFDAFYDRLFSRGHWYSLDWGNSHFVFIDSYLPLDPASTQHQWLAADLAAAAARPEIKFTFVSMHNPVWTIFPYGYYAEGPLIEPLFSQYGVDAVFSGHIHLYERSDVDGRIYICSSGGGGPLRDPPMDPTINPYYVLHHSVHHYLRVEVEDDQFTIHAIDALGNEFDSVTRSAD